VIATRLKTRSEAMLDWIDNPDRYRLTCDRNLQLLKMEIFTGFIPPWLTEEDRKGLTAKRRRKIIAEAVTEGAQGFSGRDSIKIFNDFHSTYAKEGHLINMSMLCGYFTRVRKDLAQSIPEGFLESMLRMYDYSVLQEVKESLYYYNEEQISRDIKNYMFAINFENGARVKSSTTGDRIEVTDAFLEGIENRLLGTEATPERRHRFRKESQKVYTTHTLPQEIMLEGRDVTATALYEEMRERYVFNLKEKVLEPFLENENFRKAIKDIGEERFKTYDRRIREDVTYLMENLEAKFRYSPQGAREMCIYVIDNDLARRYGDKGEG
jgi:hypothetical protein